MYSNSIRIVIFIVYVLYTYLTVEGWSCSSMSNEYIRVNDDVTLRFTVTVLTYSVFYKIYSYNTFLGIIVISTESVLSDPEPGMYISGDVRGNVNVTIPKVQDSNAGIYRVESSDTVNQCLFLYILGKPLRPQIASNKVPTVGENIKLTCSSTSNTVPSNHSLNIKYAWKINNTNIPPDTRFILSSTGASLTVVNVNKSDAKSRFTCTAQEDVSQGYISDNSNNFTINVLYPPDGRPTLVNHVHGNTYSVIENTTGTLSCTIKGGNPRPTLTWICYNQGSYTYPDSQTVIKTVTWTTKRGTDVRCTCQCPEAVVAQQSAYVDVRILYPPSTPSFLINSQTVSGINIKVTRGKSLTVTCNSSSEPAPSSYTWRHPDGATLVNQILTINNVQTSQNGQYACGVENTMRPSSGGTVPGKADRKIQLLVLYPPEIGALSNKSVVEGSMLQLQCFYTSGSPADTTFKWTRNGDQRVWNTQQLTIPNVLRTDDMMYTCLIYNTMNPTNDIEVKGERSGSFHLNVLYKTSITSFYIHGYNNKETVTVDETTDVDLTCQVASNPESRISILFHDNAIKSVTGSAMTHIVKAVTCRDTGIYKCAGQNDYNARIPSVKIVTMYVQCRPSAYGITQEKIISAQNVEVSLNVSILANPRPDQVTWQILHGNKWISVEESELVKISALPIQINETLLTVTQLSLTFLNVTQSNYGHYRMIAKNLFSDVIQNFYLQAQEKPDQPTDMKVTIEHHSKLTVQWKPGFDGGLRQTFILRYKREKDVAWKDVKLADTGEEMMSFTIPDLTPGTRYQLMIYAGNDIGNSTFSEILSARTSDEEQVEESNIAALIGGIVGGLAFILAAMVLLLRRFWTFNITLIRKTSNTGNRRENESQQYEDLRLSNLYEESANTAQHYTSYQQETSEYEAPQCSKESVYDGTIHGDGNKDRIYHTIVSGW